MADATDYSAFDAFLKIDTWHTSHPLDHERFFQVLDKAVRHPQFNAEEMGEYFRNYHEIERDASEYHDLNLAVDNYVSWAWAVREYLKVTGHL